jgi:hypothetical protein
MKSFITCTLQKVSRRMRWAERVARMGEMRNVYKIYSGKTYGKKLFGKTKRGWEDNVRMVT